MFKRIILFIATNILVMVTISILLNILGVGHYIEESGLNYQSLMIFCLVWGMGGAFISLALSRVMAKWMMKVQVIDPNGASQYSWLVQMVSQQCRAAQLAVVPEVGVYDSPEVNAFATGPTKSRALVALSTGLIDRMSRNEVEGVVAHELAHIKNGDMVTMTLIQGVMNAFVMFFARVISFAISQNVREESRSMVRILVTIVLDICLSILGSILVAWFSRQREYRADAGSAVIAGREKMIAALEALKRFSGQVDPEAQHASLATMKISSGTKRGFMALLGTHPSLDDRIARLRNFA